MLAALANPILPIFAVIFIGIVFGRKGIFTPEMAKALNTFVFYIGQPALIFLLAARSPLDAYDVTALGSYFAVEVALYAVVAFVAVRVFGTSLGEGLVLGMTTVFVNHLYYVLPIVTLLKGESAAIPVEGAIFTDLAILYCGTVFIVELISRGGASVSQVPVILARNPALWALLLGLMANLSGFGLPEGLYTFADFVGRTAPATLLFVLGITMANVRLFSIDKLTGLVIALALIAQPALMYLLGQFNGADAQWQATLVLLAAGPCGAMPFVIALKYGIPTDRLTRAILAATVLSLPSLAFLTRFV
ncbi:AEC family transporter [Aliamphritea ceti]|uniref:AEC family transporter n=1 Tax=Aliamphritea ceti TaxID=1524258 RepID=UPI0021C36848|nr:AEC family transporter [Aliamphritea ceti]